jgi:hypothetical protein
MLPALILGWLEAVAVKQDLNVFVAFIKSFAHSQGHLLPTGATRRGRRERHFCTLSLFRSEELERWKGNPTDSTDLSQVLQALRLFQTDFNPCSECQP